MIRNWKRFVTAALCAIAFGQAWAQAPQFAEQSKCKEIENAKFVDVYSGGNTSSGTPQCKSA